MGKECAIIILLYKAVNNEDEHNNTIKKHSGIMPLNIENYSMAPYQSDFSIIVVVVCKVFTIDNNYNRHLIGQAYMYIFVTNICPHADRTVHV